jgi:hypothetical protein
MVVNIAFTSLDQQQSLLLGQMNEDIQVLDATAPALFTSFFFISLNQLSIESDSGQMN